MPRVVGSVFRVIGAVPRVVGSSRRLSALVFASLVLLSSVVIHAHEAGTTRVSVVLHENRTYDIDVVTDAGALVEKLNALADKPAPVNASVASLQSQLAAFDGDFRERVAVAVDGTSMRPAITYTVAPAVDATSVPSATVHLTGELPPAAQHLTWKFGWTFTSYTLTIRRGPGDNPTTEQLDGDQTSKPIELRAPSPVSTRIDIATRYLTRGFTHIVPLGLDHVLFVLGVFLLSGRPRTVLLQITAFTVAHSITLGLSMYGIVSISSGIIEPLIALSIAYVAIENICLSELKAWRMVVVSAFGLLHGLGLAGALRDEALPRSEFMTALLTFNLGVEAGQLAVIGVAFILVGYHWSSRAWYRGRVVVPASALIACTAVYWTIERLSM